MLPTLQTLIGLKFRDESILLESLVHSSYVNEHPDQTPISNERLEFLGDAVLDFLVAAHLHDAYPEMSEGDLTASRAVLVSGDNLAVIARKLNLGNYILLGQGESANGGRNRNSTLAGALEALIGALYIDSGLDAAHSFVNSILGTQFKEFSVNGIPKDPKSLLQEIMQSRGHGLPLYRIIEEDGKPHAKRFTSIVLFDDKVLGTGIGNNKSEAERAAALDALDNTPL